MASTRRPRIEAVNAETRAREDLTPPPVAEKAVNLGARLREVRLKSGLSLRSVARELGVSPSFVSQLENDRSRPSVGTLYSLAQLLDVSMDQLFETAEAPGGPSATDPVDHPPTAPIKSTTAISRSDLGSPADAWEVDAAVRRMSITRPGHRSRLEMDSGVVWEQLASSAGHGVDFIEIIYAPGSSSTNDGRMLRPPASSAATC